MTTPNLETLHELAFDEFVFGDANRGAELYDLLHLYATNRSDSSHYLATAGMLKVLTGDDIEGRGCLRTAKNYTTDEIERNELEQMAGISYSVAKQCELPILSGIIRELPDQSDTPR